MAFIEPCFGIGHNLSLICQMTSEDIKHQLIFIKLFVACLPKLQALVYDILPSTTAAFSYAPGSRKLSANEQFFAGAQTVVGLLQTTQIKQGVSFIAANKVYTSTNKSIIVWIETELFFFTRGGSVSYLRACLGARLMSWCLLSSDVIWHIRDKLWPMPKHGSIKSTYVRCMRV